MWSKKLQKEKKKMGYKSPIVKKEFDVWYPTVLYCNQCVCTLFLYPLEFDFKMLQAKLRRVECVPNH